MSNLKIKSNPEVEQVFNNYPKDVRDRILHLRSLILETAQDKDDILEIEETLRWGEPSYLVKKGSTIRIDWKKDKPNQYGIYFKCTSKLVATFKMVYNNIFKYEDTRAIIFHLEEKIPEAELKKCIAAGLTYHKVKQLPLLGMQS